MEGSSVNMNDLNINENKAMKIDDFTVLKVIGTGSYGKVVLS